VKFLSSCLLVAGTLAVCPALVRAECKEYKIVEFEDRVEAVCVGEPLTEAEKKALQEEEKRQELENKKLRAQEDRQRKDAEIAAAAEEKRRVRAEAEKKKQETRPPVTAPSSDKGKVNLMRQ